MASSQNRDPNGTNATVIDGANVVEWTRYFSAAQQLRQTNDSMMVGLNLSALMGSHLDEFWRYEGSLTSPTCDEIVAWTVFKTPIVIDESDIDRLRRNVFPFNYREPQPPHNRVVYRNFLDEVNSSVRDHKFCANGVAHWRSQLATPMLLFMILLLSDNVKP